MKYLKHLSFFIVTILFFISCSENNFSPTGNDSDTNLNSVKKRKPKITTQSTDSLRYDDLPDLANFVTDGRKWDHTNITYYFSNGTADISGNQEQQAIQDALDLWANVTPLTFTEVSTSSQADIIVLWATGDHGDGSPFDSTNGILAHAFFPPPNGGSIAGDAHFDDAETWTLSTRSNGVQPIDLTTVAAHEFGHSLGLGHSQVSGALMKPYYTGSHRYLSQDDKDGIQNIYGSPPPPPLNVSLSGPSSLLGSQQGSWTASASGGTLSYSYSWKYRERCTNLCTWGGWHTISSTSSHISRSFGNPQQESREVQLEVNVSSGAQNEGDYLNINVEYLSGSGFSVPSTGNDSVSNEKIGPFSI